MAYTQENQQTFQFHNFPPSFVFFWLLRLVLATAEQAPLMPCIFFCSIVSTSGRRQSSQYKKKFSLIQIFDLVKILCWMPFMAQPSLLVYSQMGQFHYFMHKKRRITTSRCVHDAEMLQEIYILVQPIHFKGTFVVDAVKPNISDSCLYH